MSAYYNEMDEFAAEWLRNLIAKGHIADGTVDSRSILDVKPDDLRGFKQCHFFAGIGVWSYALRLAGWPDDREVWTGSCPCQPFSVAGVGSGMDDERHLWPFWFHLIEQRKPAVVFGEQVEAAIKHNWLDLVQSDLEGIGYAVAPVGIPAAGVGAPHIRQRLWFVADADCSEQQTRDGIPCTGRSERAGHNRRVGELGNDDDEGLEGLGRGHQAESGRDGTFRSVAEAGESRGLADTDLGQPGAQRGNAGEVRGLPQGKRQPEHGAFVLGGSGSVFRVADPLPAGRAERRAESRDGSAAGMRCCGEHGKHAEIASPTNGHWRDADWLFCRDGKWRPVEPGTFPLAHGVAGRVGRLRAYGNAIVPQVAAEVIAAFMECRP